jgi:2-succinyl-5-enolpyruvyl-6-hydroxy-3-cyclohexene-1-carboxylate synthase
LQPNNTQLWAEALIDELARGGVAVVTICPGSRSTPLVAAVAAHPGMQAVVHVDERAAAFFCLGYGRATGRPAAWITTSGTAVTHGLPAVVEASMDGVPMVCLTADRPDELRNTGANQTIWQPGIFGSYPRFALDLPAPGDGQDASFARAQVRAALEAANPGDLSQSLPGPVHLNCPFRKPLEPTGPAAFAAARVSEPAAAERGAPAPEPAAPIPQAPAPGVPAGPDGVYTRSAAKNLEDVLRNVSSGVVLAGRLDAAQALAAARLAGRLGWPLLPDVCSQLRLGPTPAHVITYADLIAGEAVPWPQVVIQVGRVPVSQRLMRWLAGGKPAVWAVIADGNGRIDPHECVTHRLAPAAAGCDALLPGATAAEGQAGLGQPSAFARAWIEAQEKVTRLLPHAIRSAKDGAHLTEPAIAAMVASSLPAGHGLFLASSMPIRDMNTFAGQSGTAPLVVAANRGASGIDGTLATAAGVSAGLDAPTTVLIGDLALIHDLNSLALIRNRPVTVVLINNDGGGIFSFLPIAKRTDLFEPYFGASHGIRFEHAAKLFGIDYFDPSTPEEFIRAYENAVISGGPTLIEVSTVRSENVTEHVRLRSLVAEWLA